MTIAGKHALVTGGGSGIGLAIARALAEAGAQVTITGLRAGVLEAVAGAGLHPLVMDVSQEAQVVAGVAEAQAARGPVQICIANAGIAEGRALHKTDAAFWRQIMATNLDGAFYTLRECLGGMRQTDWAGLSPFPRLPGSRGSGARPPIPPRNTG
jgi:NAD(P)-dependent dehydrogenase (short-subunit alcohol dehydrogenase family)